MKEKFNYIIGRYWEGTNQLSAWECFGTVHYDTKEVAEIHLNNVINKSDHKDWKIFKIGESL